MNQFRLFFFLLMLLAMLLLVTGCSGGSSEAENVVHAEDDAAENHAAEVGHEAEEGHEAEGDHEDAMSMAGMTHIHATAPEEFEALENPFADDTEAIKAGEETFQTLCATCHGPEGKGDGPAAEALDPKPATLADGAMMHTLSDGYLFWRVSKGGQMEPFNSAMPPWEAGLTEEQRWQVISFVRTLAEETDHD